MMIEPIIPENKKNGLKYPEKITHTVNNSIKNPTIDLAV